MIDRRTFIGLSLAALPAAAAVTLDRGEYLIFAGRRDLTLHDKRAIVPALMSRMKDDTPLDFAGLPTWRNKSNHTIEWRVLIVAEENLIQRQADGTKLTLTELKAWKDANLDNPARLQIKRATEPLADLDAAGLEPVPYDIP